MVFSGFCVGLVFDPFSLSISLGVLMDTSVDNAIEVLVGRRNGEDFLIKAFINNDGKLKRCMFYDNFDSKIREEKYGIISYFHELVNRDVPNLFKGGHFAGGYIIYNYYITSWFICFIIHICLEKIEIY